MLKALFNRVAVGMFRAMPRHLAEHVMFLLRSNPDIMDRWGVHVRQVHYYDPLPNFAAITPEQTTRRRESPVVDFNMPSQLALLRRLGQEFGKEVETLVSGQDQEAHEFNFDNEYFAHLDAAMYYALIRDLKPRRVIEIGSGYSTRIASLALARNGRENRPGTLTCIEPYPEPRLLEAKLDIELIERPVELVDLDTFRRLEAGDILFIDSSHAVKFQNDVCREFLEILPILQAGVWVHVHDIFFPHDYPAEWLIEKRIAFSEQYLLEAFLAYNVAYSVMAANYWLCLDYRADVLQLWPRIGEAKGPHGGASLWMRKER
jgi:predicted O-methyltransferase YrrM